MLPGFGHWSMRQSPPEQRDSGARGLLHTAATHIDTLRFCRNATVVNLFSTALLGLHYEDLNHHSNV